MDLNNIPQEVYNKIEKLLKLQESAENVGSINEAQNAALRISEILQKYNLDLKTVAGKIDENKVTVTHLRVPYPYVKREGDWLQDMMHYCCRLNSCKVVFVGGSYYKRYTGNHMFHIFGEKLNIDISFMIFEQLVVQARNIMRQEYDKTDKLITIGKFQRSFFQGFNVGLGRKVSDEINHRNVGNATSTSLMVVTDSKVKDLQNQVIHGEIRDSKGKRTTDEAARVIGYTKGKEANLNPGIGGNTVTVKSLN